MRKIYGLRKKGRRVEDDKNYFGASMAVRINLRTKLKKITFFQM